jgi:putative glycosyltransferase (TIGR04372 family)
MEVLKRLIQKTAFSIIPFTRFSSEKKISYRQVLLAFSEGIVGNKGTATYKNFRQIEEIEKLWNEGLYQESVKMRMELLERIFENFDVLTSDYCPPIYSPLFTSNVGHLPIFMLHQYLVQAGKVLKSPRILPVAKQGIGGQFVDAINMEQIDVLPIRISSHGLSHEIPSIMHLFERLDCFKTRTGFRDIYELLEETYSTNLVNQDSPLLRLSEEFCHEKKLELQRVGISPEDKYITLHVRTPRGSKDPRGSTLEPFKKPIHFLLNKGYKIIQVGGNEDSSLNIKEILEIKGEKYFGLQMYCLANSFFHLGTLSGPTELAKSFGTPILQTNTTSLGRNTFTGSKYTMYLAKHYFRNERPLNLSEILDSSIAFAEEPGILKSGVKVQENSTEEILQGVEEMTHVISTKDDEYCASTDAAVNDIRKNFKSFVRGSFSPAFLASNPNFSI